jgi:hypothetical protein
VVVVAHVVVAVSRPGEPLVVAGALADPRLATVTIDTFTLGALALRAVARSLLALLLHALVLLLTRALLLQGALAELPFFITTWFRGTVVVVVTPSTFVVQAWWLGQSCGEVGAGLRWRPV